MKQATRYCEECSRYRLHQKETVPLPIGCLVTVLTGGLFIPLWIFLDLFSYLIKWRCQTCGTKRR